MENPLKFTCCDEITLTPSKYLGRWNGYCGWCTISYLAVWQPEEKTIKYYKYLITPSEEKRETASVSHGFGAKCKE